MINFLNKFISLVNSDKFQKNIKKFNLVLTFCSFVIIFQLFQNINFSSVEFTISINNFLLGFALYLANITIWSRFMTSNYEKFNFSYLINWSRSRLGRYLPTGVLIITTRLEEKFTKDQNSKKIMYGLLEEQFLFSIIGVATVSFYLNFQIFNNEYLNFLTSSIFVILILKIIYFYLKIKLTSQIKFTFNFLLIINLNFIFLESISANLMLDNTFLVASLYYLSTSIGLLFVGVPAGLGVRELIFLLIADTIYSEVQLFQIIFNTRVIILFLDLLFGLLGNILYLFNKK